MEKVYIVTGGSSGIGKECASSLKDGKVVITARNEERLQNAVKELKEEGVDAVYKTCDISKREDIKELMEYASSLGELHSVINSAGVSGVGASAKLTFEIDLVGTEMIIEEAKDYLVADGSIVLISSMMGYVVPANEAYDPLLENPLVEGNIDKLVEIVDDKSDGAYNFSKRGVHLLVKKYANELGEKGVRIVSISPGVIMTPMAEEAAKSHPEQMEFLRNNTPAGRNGRPEDIVNAVNFLISDQAEFITGTDLLVDGGLVNNLINMEE